MSGITPEGKLLMIEQERAFEGEDVIHFLKHALRRIGGKLLIIWDGSPIHRARVVKEFLADDAAADRVQLEQFYPATLRISTQMKGSGGTSSMWS